MSIEHKREENACAKCKKLNTEVGPITHYTDPHDGYEGLLCSECIKRREKPYTEKCPKCKKLAYQHGGMSVYGEVPNDFEDMCLECVEKKEVRDAKIAARTLKIKNFAKDHWKFWITLTIAIIGLIIGISRYN